MDGEGEPDDYFGAARASSGPPSATGQPSRGASRARGFDGPDFVDGFEEDFDFEHARAGALSPDDADDDSDDGADEEREVAHLAQYRGFGLGSVVDRLIGWTLFEVPDDGGEDDDEDIGVTTTLSRRGSERSLQQALRSAGVQSMPKLDSAAAPSAKGSAWQDRGIVVGTDTPPAAPEGEEASGWKDAAWLLSVASKVLF